MTETTSKNGTAWLIGLGALALALARDTPQAGHAGGSGGGGSGETPTEEPASAPTVYGTSPYAYSYDRQYQTPPTEGPTRQSDPTTLNERGGPATISFAPAAPIHSRTPAPLITPGTDRYALETREHYAGTSRPVAYDRAPTTQEAPVDFRGSHTPPGLPNRPTPSVTPTSSFGLTPAPFRPPIAQHASAALAACDDAICRLAGTHNAVHTTPEPPTITSKPHTLNGVHGRLYSDGIFVAGAA